MTDKIKKCCCNCEYYYATPEKGTCSIDKQDIPPELSRIVKCKAYNEWWGAVK